MQIMVTVWIQSHLVTLCSCLETSQSAMVPLFQGLGADVLDHTEGGGPPQTAHLVFFIRALSKAAHIPRRHYQ